MNLRILALCALALEIARRLHHATKGPVWGNHWGEPCPDEVAR